MDVASKLLLRRNKPVNDVAEVISQSGLFDLNYYQEKNFDVVKANIDPIEHYVAFGAFEGRNPHPLFDNEYYFKQSPGLKKARTNPLWHYITFGVKQGLDPNPYFDTSYYLENNPDIAASTMNPLFHYIFHGGKERRNPSNEFDTSFYIWQYSDVVPEVINPLEHFILYGLPQGRAIKDKFGSENLKANYLRLRQIEPLLPFMNDLNALPKYLLPDNSVAGEAYFKLANMIDRPFSHLYLLPGVGYGGCERVCVNFTKILMQEADIDAPLILMPDHNDYALKKHFPSEARIIYFDELVSQMTTKDKVAVLTRFIIQSEPKVVHNFNSYVGWLVYRDYYRQLLQYTQLAVCLFAHDMDKEGMPAGYSIEFFNQCIDHLKWVFTDNNYFKNELSNRFALEQFNSDKIVVIHQPMDFRKDLQNNTVVATDDIDTKANTKQQHVLWASRVDQEKRPDLLIDIAKAMPDIQFHVYGRAVLKTFPVENLNGIANLQCHGPFDNFHHLPIDNISLFLYTSERDGMPNVLLEATSCGLPIVASNVGGISDFISEETGWLISDYENVDVYVQAIRDALLRPDERKKRAQAAQNLLASRYSWVHAAKTLHSLRSYF